MSFLRLQRGGVKCPYLCCKEKSGEMSLHMYVTVFFLCKERKMGTGGGGGEGGRYMQ